MVDPKPVFGRLGIFELPFDRPFICPEQLDPRPLQLSQQPREQCIPGPAHFAIGLIAYIDTTTGKCPLCGHEEDEEKESFE
jgi:hypothetical protein